MFGVFLVSIYFFPVHVGRSGRTLCHGTAREGKDQQYIVSQLLQKGCDGRPVATYPEKYEAEQNQPGALDLTGTTQAKSGTSRLRTNKEKTRDERQKQNGYMIRSQREIKDGEDKTLKNQQLNEEIGFMDIDSLIYYRNYF